MQINITNPTGGGDVPLSKTTIMITIKKATKKQAKANADKMKAAAEKLKQRKESKQ